MQLIHQLRTVQQQGVFIGQADGVFTGPDHYIIRDPQGPAIALDLKIDIVVVYRFGASGLPEAETGTECLQTSCRFQLRASQRLVYAGTGDMAGAVLVLGVLFRAQRDKAVIILLSLIHTHVMAFAVCIVCIRSIGFGSCTDPAVVLRQI